MSEKNTGDRLMVEALLEGGYALGGLKKEAAQIQQASMEIVKSDQARFFHAVPADDAREMMYAALEKDEPRFLQAEDRAMSWFGVAREAGWDKSPGEVSPDQANKLLKDTATVAWQRIRGRLKELERANLVEVALCNHYAVQRDAATWRLTAQALLALHDQTDVIRAANRQDSERNLSSLATRVIVEMAICESPLGGGRRCSKADLDYLIANMSMLLECAICLFGALERLCLGQPSDLHYDDTPPDPASQANHC